MTGHEALEKEDKNIRVTKLVNTVEDLKISIEKPVESGWRCSLHLFPPPFL